MEESRIVSHDARVLSSCVAAHFWHALELMNLVAVMGIYFITSRVSVAQLTYFGVLISSRKERADVEPGRVGREWGSGERVVRVARVTRVCCVRRAAAAADAITRRIA